GKASFQFNVPSAAYAEDTEGKLTINAKPRVNARKVTSTLSSSCASIVGSGKQYLGDMTAEKEYSVEYYVKPTQNGICSLTLLLDYYDASGTETVENTTIGISVERASIDLKIVDIEDGNLALGGVSNITLKIENLGNTHAGDVTVSLNLSSPFTPVKSAQKYVGDVAAGQTSSVAFTVSVDSSAKKKSYSIPVSIEYYDPSDSKQKISIDIGMEVGGSADVKVNLDEKDLIAAGSSGKVTIGVVNRGFVDAKFLTLKLLGTDKYKVTSSDSAYIGALNSDDSDSQEFEIKVFDNVKDEEIPLMVRVEYKEENNDKLIVKEEQIDLNLLSKTDYAKTQNGGGILAVVLTIVGIVIALIVVYLGVWILARVLGLVTSLLDRKIFKRNSE
ncbi:MAG: hypothetical protein FJY77_06215, partial [Candidatus Altiarchaeales archaeon]|nr:hypothetical protein [Candidatus Altiarchaeales archaeon]